VQPVRDDRRHVQLVRRVVHAAVTKNRCSHAPHVNTALPSRSLARRTVLIPAYFFLGGGGILAPAKKTYNPLDGCQTVCSKSFFGWDDELQIYHGNFLFNGQQTQEIFRHEAIKRVHIYA